MHYKSSVYVDKKRIENMPSWNFVTETARLSGMYARASERLDAASGDEKKTRLYAHQLRRMEGINSLYTDVAIERMQKLSYERTGWGAKNRPVFPLNGAAP